MQEWDVVLVLTALAGLFASVYRPMTSNTRAMTKLNITMQNLAEKMARFEVDMDKMDIKNHESHQRIWDHNAEQDKKIEEQEKRIYRLEKGRRNYE